MTLLNSMGLLSTIALLIPIILLLAFKLAWYKSFPALFFYYVLLLSYNFFSLNYISVGNAAVTEYHKIINDLLETPLVLIFFTYFSRTAEFRKKLIGSIFVFIAFEIVTLIICGFNNKATTIILAPGLLAILSLSILFFIHQVKIAVIYLKAIGKAIMIASLVFAYAGFGFVFIVNNLLGTQYTMDVYLIYYLVTIITSVPLCVGIYFERKRVRQLSELQTTREELKKIYGDEDPRATGPFGKVALNYDKEQWN
ncbi:MAG: hypothetical protein ABIR18_13075 [Chitinophagaceae bacterium]